MRTKLADGTWKPFSPRQTERLYRKVSAVRVIFEKVARIVSGLPILLRWDYAAGDHYMAYTDGEHIWLNRDKIHRGISILTTLEEVGRYLAGVKGLIYHELSHILYSPRDTENDLIAFNVIEAINRLGWDRELWIAYNVLEDQRIEAIFVGRYRPARRYFEAAVMQWICDEASKKSGGNVFPYIAGRRYIRPAVRKAASDKFQSACGTKSRDRIQAIVDKFITLEQTPSNTQEGVRLVQEFYAILKHNGVPLTFGGGPMPDQYADPGYAGGGNPGIVSNGAAVPSKEQVEDLKRAAEEDAEAEAQAEADAESEAESGDGEGDGAGDGGEEGETPAGKTPEPGAGPTASNDTPGTGVGAPNRGAVHTYKETVEEAIEEMFNDPKFARELKTNAKSVLDIADGTMASDNEAPSNPKEVPQVGRVLTAKIIQELRPLKLDLEPERFIRQTAGRLAIRRVLGAQPHEIDLFDAWDDSLEEEGGIEAAICLDLSGSMSGRLYEASLAMWGLKRGFDQIGVKTTVLGYADDWYVLYDKNDKTKANEFNNYGQCGGTDPSGALKHVHKLFTKSQERNKLLVSITDGGWFCDQEDPDDIVSSINAIPGTTSVLIGLNPPGYRGREDMTIVNSYGDHNHMVAVDVFGAMDIPPVVRQFAANIMRGASSKAR